MKLVRFWSCYFEALGPEVKSSSNFLRWPRQTRVGRHFAGHPNEPDISSATARELMHGQSRAHVHFGARVIMYNNSEVDNELACYLCQGTEKHAELEMSELNCREQEEA